jgi:ABC-type branched-subunit amino acid transport system ATPase component
MPARPAPGVTVNRSSTTANAGAGLNSELRELRVDSVSKTFAGLNALSEVSLTLAEQEVVGLIGPNGSGKTTLLNVISGSLRPSSGTISVGGRVITGIPAHRVARMRIARTFQNIRLFGQLTVLENVEAGLTARPRGLGGRGRKQAREVLAEVGISPSADRLAGTLPYGEQRRVEIALAVAGDPRFLLLDEPGAGMNPDESDELLETLTKIRDRRGCGLLVVDHDLRLIMTLCERIHVLNEGRTIAEGSPREVEQDTAVIAAYLGTNRGVGRAKGGSRREEQTTG